MPDETTPVVLSCEVDPYHDGWTVIDFLCHRFRYLDRRTWAERIATGRIRVNGRPGSADLVVATGDTVEYEVDVVEPPVDFAYDVAFDDDDLLVISKSGNIPVHAGGTYFRHTLVARLREDTGVKVNLAHRLDRETSGLIIFTKTVEAARGMAAAFSKGEVEKEYLAVVRGHPPRDTFTIDAPVGSADRDFPIARSVIDHARGKSARTGFRVVDRLRGFAVVEARPLTGRKNQIRLHLEHAGHPVVGDKIYGMPRDLIEERLISPDSPRVRSHLMLPRHALHATRLRFRHPCTDVPLDLGSPVPSDMARFIESRR